MSGTSDLTAALGVAWPAFVLVASLLVLGVVADAGGLFRWAGGHLERLPGPPVVLGLACLALVAAVTAVLNLDTAVVFVTPVVVEAARRRHLDPVPVAYAALIMANASSLLLPGANLTNLIAAGDRPIDGGRWITEILPAGAVAVVVTATVLLLLDRRAWAAAPRPGTGAPAVPGRPSVVAVAGTVVAGVAIVLLGDPALPVLAVACVVLALAAVRQRSIVRAARDAVGPVTLGTLFVAVVALGVLARNWSAPADLVADVGPLATAAIAAIAAVTVNNLPAAALLTTGHPAHPEALLVGLNLGPNLLVTGSLASLLWWRTCRTADVAVTLRGLASRAPLTAVPAIVCAALLVAS